MAEIKNLLPIRAVRGLFGGAADGFHGKVDANEHFSDGAWENDPEKKSRAGRFLSEYAGVHGGYEKGNGAGKWVGAIGCALLAATFFIPFAIGLAGIFPFFAAAVAIGCSAWLGANLGAVAGRSLSSVSGGIIGTIGGALVGTYNAVFNRGAYLDPEAAQRKADKQAQKAAEKAQKNGMTDTSSKKEKDALGVGLNGGRGASAGNSVKMAGLGLLAIVGGLFLNNKLRGGTGKSTSTHPKTKPTLHKKAAPDDEVSLEKSGKKEKARSREELRDPSLFSPAVDHSATVAPAFDPMVADPVIEPVHTIEIVPELPGPEVVVAPETVHIETRAAEAPEVVSAAAPQFETGWFANLGGGAIADDPVERAHQEAAALRVRGELARDTIGGVCALDPEVDSDVIGPNGRPALASSCNGNAVDHTASHRRGELPDR